MKIKHLLFFIPVTFLVACEGTDLIEPDNGVERTDFHSNSL